MEATYDVRIGGPAGDRRPPSGKVQQRVRSRRPCEDGCPHVGGPQAPERGTGMIAAVYARKSTDQNLPDEEKSVTRQIERARAYATAKGWRMGADVYADDGISGAEFQKRPGFLRLMNALKPRPPFQVLIMSEESRLGREQIETAYALKQIMDARVRRFL